MSTQMKRTDVANNESGMTCTFSTILSILTCGTSLCAAIIAAFALVILISQHWGNTTTSP